jgi:oligo-1,6-glucosidase
VGIQNASLVEKDFSVIRTWWKEQIIYQIYPRSFKDSNGTGVGDLNGIIDKLDYIESLGVTSVWLNPIYQSPNDDNGYDISNYCAIMREFGSMEDFDTLLEGLHKRNMKFVMDLVVNHTSDEHEWFKQSRSSRHNPYRDYYHWWPAEKGKPNFRWSFFDEKGEAWKYDEQTDAYYLHYFSQKQPDLNWENPKVRQEVYNIMHFWAKKGVDGFRLDAFQYVSKDTEFPKWSDAYEHNFSHIIPAHGMGPHLHDYSREMYKEVVSKYDVFTVSEGVGSTFEDAHALVDEDRNELQMAYHFDCADMCKDEEDPLTLLKFKQVHTRWDKSFADKGWLSIFLANHDSPRIVSRFGDDRPEYRDLSAKMLNTFLLSMRGTPYCYFGDELGMTNINFESIDEYHDIAALNGYKKAQHQGDDLEKFMRNLKAFSRDNSRTPMQWSRSQNAGFTEGTPWISVNSNHLTVNVEAQNADPASVLNHFRRMTALRKQTLTLIYGDYTLLVPEHESLYVYTRSLEEEKLLIALNFSDKKCNLEISSLNLSMEVLINNYPELSLAGDLVVLAPYQAVIIK